MPLIRYRWALRDEFLNRSEELARLETWWSSSAREPLALIGRRRVGKSWLFRRFADGKPALILVAEQLPERAQLTRFAEILEPVLGFRPDVPDVPTLIRVLFRAARTAKLVAIIDEFPWLLGTSATGGRRALTAIQAVMEEERDDSKLKLILCGSQVAQMESLFGEKNPMHGRLERLLVRPLSFAESWPFLDAHDPIAAFERFAIAGGMPMYLTKLAHGPLRTAVCNAILDRDAPLWNEGRSMLDQELREPRVYFAILEQLTGGAKSLNEIAQPLRMETGAVAKYLSTLIDLRLASKKEPFGAPSFHRAGRWQLDDSFLRFWFRFVFPHQSDLESGLRAEDLYDNEVADDIADHVSPVFENWCLEWLRSNRSAYATNYGNWWGNATNEFRKTKERSSEEIDAVGTKRNKVTIVAEAKWTNKQLTPQIVADLDTYKIPALRHSLQVVTHPRIALFSKSGYSTALHELADTDPRIELIDIAAELQKQQRQGPYLVAMC